MLARKADSIAHVQALLIQIFIYDELGGHVYVFESRGVCDLVERRGY